mgnify:CR=1 FL=1
MPEYKDYVVNGIETISEIAQKQLGYTNAISDLILINKLRYPYISDNPKDQLGKEIARIPLSQSISFGDHGFSIPLSDLSSANVTTQQINSGDVLFFSENYLNGDMIHDLMYVESVLLNLPNNSIEITFDTEKISAPLYSMQEYGLVFIANRNSTTGNYAWPTELNLQSSIPANISDSGRYYFSYSYVDYSGNETFSSPIKIFFDPLSSSYKPEFLSLTTEDIINGYQFIIRSPSVFPTGVDKVNVYISKFDLTSAAPSSTPTQSLQFTFDAPNMYKEISSLVFSTQTIVQNRAQYSLARIGITHSYKTGSYFGLYAPLNSLNTKVLKSGDILKIPTSRTSTSSTIGTFASDSFTNTYGIDIMLDDYGQISFSGQNSNDLTTVKGVFNVKQALNNRLQTYVGQITTQPRYGNLALGKLGSKFSNSNLTKVQRMCVECVMSDPRVKNVKSVDVQYDFNSGSIIVSNFSIELMQIGSTISLSPVTIPI